MIVNKKHLTIGFIGFSVSLATALLLTSCSKKKDPFLGTWENVGNYGTLKLEIKKDGNGYLVYHSHEPLQHEVHDHGHEHSEDEKIEPHQASLKNGSLYFTIEGKPWEIKLAKDQKVLTVFERSYRKISDGESAEH